MNLQSRSKQTKLVATMAVEGNELYAQQMEEIAVTTSRPCYYPW